MKAPIQVRQCKICGEVKYFNVEEWLVSRGVPSGSICKKCVAEKRKAERQAIHKYHKKTLSLGQLNVDQLLELSDTILYVIGVSEDAILQDEQRFTKVQQNIHRHGLLEAILLDVEQRIFKALA
jgi:predicted KAP-like P-loop ATPase